VNSQHHAPTSSIPWLGSCATPESLGTWCWRDNRLNFKFSVHPTDEEGHRVIISIPEHRVRPVTGSWPANQHDIWNRLAVWKLLQYFFVTGTINVADLLRLVLRKPISSGLASVSTSNLVNGNPTQSGHYFTSLALGNQHFCIVRLRPCWFWRPVILALRLRRR
jgi:hypothetical protein